MLFRLCSENSIGLVVSGFRGWLMAAAAAASTSSSSSKSSSHQHPPAAAVKIGLERDFYSRISEGAFRPPGNLFLRFSTTGKGWEKATF